MILNISFKHIAPSDALKEFTREKCERLTKYFKGKTTVTWNFTVENMSKIAHCHIVGNQIDYFGEASTEDFHASVDEALDKIEKQIRRKKEIVKDHLHKNGHRTPQES